MLPAPSSTCGGACPAEPSPSAASLLFVYGTLQRLEINFPFWMANQNAGEEEVVFLGTAQTAKKYPLFVNPPEYQNGSPCLVDVEGEGHVVEGEVFRVPSSRLAALDTLEGVVEGIYMPKSIDVRMIKKAAPFATHDDGIVTAVAYFRKRKCPPWNSPHVTLLSKFSARQAHLAASGSYHCQPAHMVWDTLVPAVDPKPMILVILDGIGDAQVASLGDRTPLEHAALQNESLSCVTRSGLSGLMDSFRPGVPCGSDTAHLSMLGYDPRVYYGGRGAFESLGAGMSMIPDEDIAFKCNLSVWDKATGIVTHRRCDRNFTEEGPILCAALNDTVVDVDIDGMLLEHGPHRVLVKYATEHRCGVVVQGKFLSAAITGTDPLSDNLPIVTCKPTSASSDDEAGASARYTCRVIEAVSKRFCECLTAHPLNAQRMAMGKLPANIVLLRGAAKRGFMPPFVERHGLRGFMIAPTCIIQGLGVCCGLDIVRSRGGTGDYHSDLNSKGEAALEALAERTASGRRRYHFCLVHVKGTDDAGHDGLTDMKSEMLQRSGALLQMLWDGVEDGTTIAVTGDHSTLCSMEEHTTEPVPFSIATKSGTDGKAPHLMKRHWPAHDNTTLFSESECAWNGALGRFQGEHLIPLMKAYHFDVPLV